MSITKPVTPLGNRVVAVQDKAETKTSTGLYLPENAAEQPVVATVIAVGPDVKGIKVDDRIVYKEYATTELKVSGNEYLIVNEEDVLATV